MKWPFRKSDGRPEWSHARAEKLIGSTVLVGLIYDEPAGERLNQFYGTVMSVDPEEGITLRLQGSRSGEVYTLPPDLRALFRADAANIDCGRPVRSSRTLTTRPLGRPRRLH